MTPPTTLLNDGNIVLDPQPTPQPQVKSNVLHRSLHASPPVIQSAKGLYFDLKHASGKSQTLLDATGGAAVSCLGHGNQRVKDAILKQMDEVSYAHSLFFVTNAGEELGRELVSGTEGEMGAVFIVSSGTSFPSTSTPHSLEIENLKLIKEKVILMQKQDPKQWKQPSNCPANTISNNHHPNQLELISSPGRNHITVLP
jgi:hypothetical protein